jgi:hypothetical protein
MVAINTMDYVSNFIQSHSLPQVVAEGVLRTEEDCKDFYIGFYGRNRYVVDDLLDYREHRIETSEIILDTFLEMCYTIGMRETFEQVFFQSFSKMEIAKVAEAIVKGKVTLESLFTDFQKNPNKNILKNVI